MNLQDALRAAADYLHLNGNELVQYAEETPKFGADAGFTYGGMSIDREEGMFLYALVRALKPEHALEIGVFHGVSSLHILSALHDNGSGDLTSFDNVERQRVTESAVWSVRIEDATTADLPAADFVYEDSDHQMPAAADILAKVKALSPRVVVSHDYYSHELYADNVGFQVKMAFDSVFGADVLGLRWDNAPRGFGLWLNPLWDTHKSAEEAVATRDKQAYVNAKHADAQKTAPAKRTTTKKASAKK